MRSGLVIGLLAAVSALLSAAVLGAQGISVWVDRQSITTEEQVRLEVTIEGSGSARPELPALDDFAQRYLGQSSSVQFINGKVSRSITHTYALLPLRAGDFTIGPIAVEIEGSAYKTRPLGIHVAAAGSRPASERTVFVRAAVTPSSPFVGQQIIYTWRFFRRVDTPANAQLSPQAFEGFEVEDLGEIREFRSTIGEHEYEVSEIRKALFAHTAGVQVIPATELTAQVAVEGASRGRRGAFDSLFSRLDTETRVLRTEPIEIDVRELPAAPSDFSGLIGHFRIESEINKTDLEVGASTTQKITVAGEGNVQLIAKPRAELDGDDFKIYEDQPSTTVQRTRTGLRGSRSFPRALVPLRPGSLEVPAIALVYFDPENGTYRTTRTAPVRLDVRPSSSPEDLRLTESLAPTTGKVAVRILADDLRPIHRGLEPVTGFRPGLVAALASLLSPALAFLGLLVVQRRRRDRSQNRALYRRRGALKAALRRLNAGRDATDSVDGTTVSTILRSYAGDRLGDGRGSRTTAECVSGLLAAGLPEPLAARLEALLVELDVARYGAATSELRCFPRAELAALLSEIDEALERC